MRIELKFWLLVFTRRIVISGLVVRDRRTVIRSRPRGLDIHNRRTVRSCRQRGVAGSI